MLAVRVHQFGPPDVLSIEDVAEPTPGRGEVLVQVKSAGVGPWDALIRAGKSTLPQALPLTLGSDIAGVIRAVGPGVEEWRIGDHVFGATNERFTGGCAEYAIAQATMIAAKPKRLNYTHAASVPVVAVTAWQMVADFARPSPGQTVVVHGGAGNVGRYAVQFAKRTGALIIATASAENAAYVRELGADGVVDYRATRFYERLKAIDVVLDTVGGETLEQSYQVLKPGGILVSSAAQPSEERAAQYGVRALFCAVHVTSERLKAIAELIDRGELTTEVGEVLWLNEARRAHEMLGGAPHRRGKIVIKIAD
jgi:NADPH:quinone reductase-like Zn-dependent oxidoreductase